MTKKYPKVQKNTQTYHCFLFTGGATIVAKNTQNGQKVPWSTKKYSKVHNCKGDHSFLTGGTIEVAKNTQNDQKSTQKYRKILKITHKYTKVPKSTKKYSKIHKSKGWPHFFSQGGP